MNPMKSLFLFSYLPTLFSTTYLDKHRSPIKADDDISSTQFPSRRLIDITGLRKREEKNGKKGERD
jgi:hypothetical protein